MGWDLLAQKIQFISNFYLVFQVFIYPWIPILIINLYRFYWKTLFKNVYYIFYKAFKLYFNSIGIVDMIPVNAIHMFLKVSYIFIAMASFTNMRFWLGRLDIFSDCEDRIMVRLCKKS